MDESRRKFINTSLALGATAPLVNANNLFFPKVTPSKKLKILILGGTSFLGPHQIAYALGRGHEVSTFTRGKTNPKIHTELFEKVEQLVGDRQDNLEALKNRKWDVVIDNSGHKAKWTEDTAHLLKDSVKYYMYTSSISVYYPFIGSDFSEQRKLIMEVPKDIEADEQQTFEYGVMKANSEKAATDAFGVDRTMIVRPTFIVGAGDPTNRFPYWTARLPLGGKVIIPGGKDDTVQFIDVRDLAEWMIRLLEEGLTGTYNASGPRHSMKMDAFVHGAHASFNSSVEYVRITDIDFLEKNGVYALCPWVISLPKFSGMSKSKNAKAINAGLTFRPLAETMSSTIAWWNSSAVSQERRDKLLKGDSSMIPKEAEILEKWKSKNK